MAKTNELVRQDDAKARTEAVFDKHEGAMLAACPHFTEASRAFRIAKTAVISNPKLMECTGASLLSGVMQSMQLGLILDGVLGHAYLVPYNNRRAGTTEAQLIPGYKGLMELAYRSGHIVDITCGVVRQGDHFEFEKGTNPRLSHRPTGDDSKEITAVWACARTRAGTTPFEVMTRDQVEKIRKKAKSQTGPWCDHYEEMAKKTVIRRLCKYLPSSPDLQRAVVLNELADANLPPQIEPVPTVIEDVTEDKPKREIFKRNDGGEIDDSEVPF